MKKHVLSFIFLLLLITQTNGQQYYPFPLNSNYASWTYETRDDYGQPTGWLPSYLLSGDTIIGGLNYKEIISGNGNGALRESNKVIYFIPEDSSNEYVLYDFNLNLGDTIFYPFGGQVFNQDTVIVTSVDSIPIRNVYHRVLRLNTYAYWIEGIGSVNYLLRPTLAYPVSGEDVLICFVTDTSLIYSNSTLCSTGINEVRNTEHMYSLFPNPATNQLTIHSSSFHNEAVMVSVMNVMGQTASPPTPLQRRGESATIDVSKLPAGMYFLQIKGEKYSVVKKFVKE